MVSIAPDGAHDITQVGTALSVVDVAANTSQPLAGASAFLGWSPDGTRLMYATAAGTVVANTSGSSIGTLPAGDASWSSTDAILIGSDTGVYAIHPDGSGSTLLSTGTYRHPVWAPNGTTFAYVRGASLWTRKQPRAGARDRAARPGGVGGHASS